MELSTNEYYLLGLWTFAGVVALTPMFIFSDWKKLLVIPLIFGTIYLSFLSNRDLLATPWQGKPSGEFTVRNHITTYINDQEHIVLWANNGAERLFVFPSTEQNKKELEKNQEATEQGTAMVGKFLERTKKDANGNLFTYEILEMRPIDYEKEFPKEK